MLNPKSILKSKYKYYTIEKESLDIIKELRKEQNLEEKLKEELDNEDKLSLFDIIIYSLPSFGKMSSLLLLK